ncbi:TrmH family RNA methyltransferase [Flavobacterium sp.]|uniref:TrmH family RNA methyltransferase n=1 Tax=Flavobacterium sp. TaxID=239 RepID=UPI002FDE2D81
MVSKNQIKLITGLQQKKYRIEHQLFIAEGVKVIQELLSANFVPQYLFVTEADSDVFGTVEKIVVNENEMKKISALSTPSSCLAVFKMPKPVDPDYKGLIVALDDIRDPGNLGTIIRLCDWFGVRDLLCSKTTVDLYNPKVIQATMGSVARVRVTYVDLPSYLAETSLPVFGTFMDGQNIYKEKLPAEGIIVFGNEANGISPTLETQIKNRIAIPRFGDLQQTESLNVATATAICLSEFRRSS